MKLLEVVKPFSGEEDIEQWLDRFEVAVDIVEEPNDDTAKKSKMAKMVPLLLSGPAYSTWKQLSTGDKSDFEKVAAALRRVYGKTKVSAWQEMKLLRFLPGDSVDVLADQINRLLTVVVGSQAFPEQLAAAFLLDALPLKVAEQVRMQHGEKMVLSEIVSCAKALTSSTTLSSDCAAGATHIKPKLREDRNVPKELRCYCCNQSGHVRKNCHIVCFRCQARGHFQRNCPASFSGNERAEAAVPDPAVPAGSLR